jgi:hypothetical protein
MTTLYTQSVLDSLPIAYWRFDEAALPVLGPVADSSGYDHPLSVYYNTASARYVMGIRTQGWGAMPANGGSFVAASSADFSFEYNTPFSIHFWFYGTGNSPGAGYLTVVNKCPDAAPVNGYDVYAYQNYFAFLLRNNSTTAQWMSRECDFPTTLWTQRWTHVAATYDGSSNRSGMKLYLDGVEVTYTREQGLTSMTSSIQTTVPLRVGKRDTNGGGQMWNYGAISELAMYDRALSAEEVFLFATFLPELEARSTANTQHVLRSVSRPAKNLITMAGSSSGARKKGSKLSPGVG